MQSRSIMQISAAILLLLLLPLPWRSTEAEDPWEVLKGFTLVSDSPALLEEHYAAALFLNPEKRLLAVVVFNVTCDPAARCRVNHRAAYSVFNDEGHNIGVYVDPDEQELMELVFDRLTVWDPMDPKSALRPYTGDRSVSLRTAGAPQLARC